VFGKTWKTHENFRNIFVFFFSRNQNWEIEYPDTISDLPYFYVGDGGSRIRISPAMERTLTARYR